MGYAENFDTFTFSEVLAFAKYEVEKNDLFVVGDRVFRQIRGVAIGGTLSAQLSGLYAIHRDPACALQGIAARWLSAHYKTIARSIARAMARGLGFVTPCPNKQGKNAYFSKVSDASGTACDAVNVREDCKRFGPPLWVVPCNYEANPRDCTFANSWSTPCREHSTYLYLCTVLLLRLVHET